MRALPLSVSLRNPQSLLRLPQIQNYVVVYAARHVTSLPR